ncbi:hypothetical protein CLOM_g15785 [Closterium sp. NIES-68]|nr:hypothetical protein CLOM_g15785 [Closterium sp. NIES-68]GJP78765.1 hypothetical protein CLOP_g9040 [Closterium sp. NIES-67]
MAEAEQRETLENRQGGGRMSNGGEQMADFAGPSDRARQCDDGRGAATGPERANSGFGGGEGRSGGEERRAEGRGGKSGDGDGLAGGKATWQARSGLRLRPRFKGPSDRVAKRVDAPDDVLASYDDAFLFGRIPLPMRLRAMLSKGPLARLFQILDVVATMGSVSLYVWHTYNPDNSVEWMVTLQTVFSSFFLLDYVINIFSAYSWVHYVISWHGLLDLISLLPLVLIRLNRDVGSSSTSVRLPQLLTFLRVIRTISIVKAALTMRNTIAKEIIALGFTLFTTLLVGAGIFQFAEYWGTSDAYKTEHECPQSGCTNFFDSFYFMVVTVATVGYGDVTPHSAWGRVVTVFTIFGALTYIPLQVNRLVQLASNRPYGGSLSRYRTVGVRFVVIWGVSSVQCARDLLSSFFSPLHNGSQCTHLLHALTLLAPLTWAL